MHDSGIMPTFVPSYINVHKMKKFLCETIPLAVLAGICISIGCVVNLRVGGVTGTVLIVYINEIFGNFVSCNLYRRTLFFKP